ncbi:MAG: HdeD family acid-resistance protein [Phototrophicaceae bacterium]
MTDILKQAWWVFLVRGIGALIFALLLLFMPGVTLATGIFSFVVLFAVYTIVDGISTIVGSVMRREGQWFWLLVWGIISVIAGLTALANPLLFGAFTLALMIYIVAFRSIFSGIVEIITAWQLRKEIDNEWLVAINGIFSLLFGLILLRRPITGIEVLVLVTSFYLLMSGTMQIILSTRVRGWSKALSKA